MLISADAFDVKFDVYAYHCIYCR